MTFNNAKNLHNEDEVVIKETGEHMCIGCICKSKQSKAGID